MAKNIPIYFLLFLFSCNIALAQQDPQEKKQAIAIRNIKVNYFSGRGGGFERKGLDGLNSVDKTSGKWVKFEVTYKSKSDWINKIDLRFYALLGSKRNPILLDNTINQINIAKGLNHHAVVYIHPQTIKRYGPIQLAGVMIENNGFVEDYDSWPHSSNKKWWEEYTPLHGHIKTLRQSPFLLHNPGKYEDTLEES